MANFEIFLPMLLKFEGGFADDPVDPGGVTNKGITFKTFTGCAKTLLNVDPTLENLKNLTDAQAGTIYRASYWNPVHGDEMELQDLANIVCDFYVNAGGNATRLLQRVMNGMGAELAVDGSIGPASIKALATLDQTEVYRRYKSGRITYYQNLAESQPPLRKFLNGWLNRVNAFPDL
jgi:lysozyme family protein